uniref:Phospholipid/glycerol acyltransferase domain-containing protein n=1 Tax=Strigamia maritima TaxID=126957 RepID=T1INS3_STRMM
MYNMMTTNTSIDEIDFFSWDIDNSVWSAFISPFAHTIYKWTVIVFFLCFFQVIFMATPVLFMGMYFIPTILLYIQDLKMKFNKSYTKVGTEERDIIISYFNRMSSVWHGHEMIGRENIPHGPAIFYLYHGPLAIDIYYLYSKLQCIQKHTTISIIAHKRIENVFGYKRNHRVINHRAFSREEFIDRLKNGWQFVTAIGGLEESKISDSNYRVHLANRKGVAHIVKTMNIKIPIVPIFTKNIQEAFWVPWFARPLLKIVPKKWWYLIVAIGGLPVKLTSIIGKEIEYDLSETPEEIMEKLINGMQSHIDKYQQIPGNKLRALRERFCARKFQILDI